MAQALLLPLGSDLYAIELPVVREVVPAPRLTPLPGAPAGVLGVFSLRGEVVPALDTAVLLGVGRLQELRFAVIVEAPAGLAALAASAQPTTGELGDPAGPADVDGAHGRFAVPGGVASLLSIERLLPGRLAA